MFKVMICGLLLGASAAVHAQPTTVTVELSNFKFSPNAIQLRRGTPTTLHLHNNAGGGHNFSAPEFFAAGRLVGASARLVRNGTIEVPGHGAVDVTLVPSAGRYRLKCTHTFHSTFGMKGAIVVN
jgi:plastocyanin